jgi:hypothetical protein
MCLPSGWDRGWEGETEGGREMRKRRKRRRRVGGWLCGRTGTMTAAVS